MNLQLKNGWSIQRQDSNNVLLILREKKIRESPKSGEKKEYETEETHHMPSLQSALRLYMNKIIEDDTAQEILTKIEEVETLIKNIKCK